jgi:hypothetical protein
MWNSFTKIFVGRFVQEAGRTILRGKLRMNRFTQLFLLVWFSLCGFLCAALTYAAAVGNVDWQDVSFPFIFLFFGILLVRFGAHLSKANHVVERLRELLDDFAA